MCSSGKRRCSSSSSRARKRRSNCYSRSCAGHSRPSRFTMTMNEPLTAAPRIYLVGLRGSGKTTVARILARRLGWSFADADDEIEALVGCSIVQLLQRGGIQELRDREAEVLRKVAEFDRHVIATAGGCVIRPE